MSICPLGSYPCHHVRKKPSPASYLVIECAQSKWMTTPSPCIPSYGKMKLPVLLIFGNEQNKINLLRLLCQSRGVPIWLKDDSNTPKGSCSLGVLEQCHPEKKLGCNLHHQDPISGTYHYFYYLQVKSWNFRKLWKYLCGYMVTKWCLPCQSLPSVLFKGTVGETVTDTKSPESQSEFKENVSPSPFASSMPVTSSKTVWLSWRLRRVSEDLAKQSNLCGSPLGTGRTEPLTLTVGENSPLWGKYKLVKWPWESWVSNHTIGQRIWWGVKDPGHPRDHAKPLFPSTFPNRPTVKS